MVYPVKNLYMISFYITSIIFLKNEEPVVPSNKFIFLTYIIWHIEFDLFELYVIYDFGWTFLLVAYIVKLLDVIWVIKQSI